MLTTLRFLRLMCLGERFGHLCERSGRCESVSERAPGSHSVHPVPAACICAFRTYGPGKRTHPPPGSANEERGLEGLGDPQSEASPPRGETRL
jgi:hypothetical protein